MTAAACAPSLRPTIRSSRVKEPDGSCRARCGSGSRSAPGDRLRYLVDVDGVRIDKAARPRPGATRSSAFSEWVERSRRGTPSPTSERDARLRAAGDSSASPRPYVGSAWPRITPSPRSSHRQPASGGAADLRSAAMAMSRARRRPDRRRRDRRSRTAGPAANRIATAGRTIDSALRRAERARAPGQLALHDVARRLGGRGCHGECDPEPACVRCARPITTERRAASLLPLAGRGGAARA